MQFYYANARSVRNKIAEFQNLLALETDIIAMCETFLNSDDLSSTVLANYSCNYELFCCDRAFNNHSGGVLLCMKRELRPILVSVPERFASLEIVCADFYTSEKIRVICVYRPPSSSAEFTSLLCECLEFLLAVSHPVFIVGDINLPLMRWDNFSHPASEIYNHMSRLCLENSLVQLVQHGTRLDNVLDVLLCSHPELAVNVEVSSGFGTSDHNSVNFKILSMVEIAESCQFEKRAYYNFCKANIALLHCLLANVCWPETFNSCRNVQEFWDTFMSILDAAFSVCVPVTDCSKSRKTKYPKHILKLQSIKHRMFKCRFQRGGYERYKSAARRCAKAIESHCKNVQNRILTCDNVSLFYKYINSRKKLNSGVSPLYDSDRNCVVSDSGKAAILNDQFSSVFIDDDGSKPAIHCECNAKFDFVQITPDRVCKILSKLPVKFSHSPDNVPSAVLRSLASKICVPLSTIFNVSFNTCEIPSVWKCADITAIFKKGDVNDASNYRPISLTSPICKVFEKLFVEQLLVYLHANNLLCKEQFSF